jgi:Family of unknown function (DUF5681)
MKKGRGGKAAALQKARAGSRSATEYATCYGKPPKRHQFRPGQSGNPRGRPKGAKSAATTPREILDRKIEVRTGSTLRKIRVLDAILTRFAEAALKGDTKSATFLVQRYDMVQQDQEPADSSVTADEQEIIDAYLQDYFKKGTKRK